MGTGRASMFLLVFSFAVAFLCEGNAAGDVPTDSVASVPADVVTQDSSAPGTPPPTVLWSCTFSDGACGMTTSGSGRWYTFNYTKTTKHSYDSHILGFLAAESEEGRAALPHQSEEVVSCCLSFWYTTGIADRGNLSVVLTSEDSGGSEILWSSSDADSDRWFQSNVLLYLNSSTKVEFVAVGGAQMEDVLGIDDIHLTTGDCEHANQKNILYFVNEVSCDFSGNDFCGWSPVDGDAQWAVSSTFWNTHNVGPLGDHTTGSDPYMTLTPSYNHGAGSAVRRSPEISYSQDLCFRWWYHMSGSDVGSLKLRLITSQDNTVVWSRTGFQTAWWTESFFGIQSNETFVLEIWGTQGDNLLANLAVDDIEMNPGHCPENVDTMGSEGALCTFEQGSSCGMQSDLDNKWTVTRSSAHDHTTGTNQGHVYELRGSNSSSSIARLESPIITVGIDKCVSFYYWIEGTEDASLIVSLEREDGTTVGDGVQLVKMGDPCWRAAVIGLQRVYGENMKVVFTGSVGPDQDTVIALDDMLLVSNVCTPELSVQCNFVNTTCLWTNDPQGLQWFSSDSYTEHTLNGPEDSESQEHYAIFETAPHHTPGSTARLSSPTITKSFLGSYFCFSFSYTACCEHGGILSIIMVDIASNNKTLLWRLPITSKHADSEWHTGQVQLKDLPNNYILVVQGEVWDGREGFLAFRNTHLQETVNCPMTPEDAAPKPVSSLPQATPISLMADSNTFSCDFEDASRPTCDFVQDDEGVWQHVSAADPPSSYTPIVDHTFKNSSGHYITAEYPSFERTQVTARLRSPVLDSSLDYCITFFLHHIGDSPPPVTVYAEAWEGQSQETLLHLQYPIKDMWVLVEREVAAGTIDGPFIIAIEALIKDIQDGDAAVDDLKVVDSRCPREEDLSCSFNLGLCGFVQEERRDDLDWLWHDGAGDDDLYLPAESRYHTHYIYLDTTAPKGSSGVIYTTEYNLTGPHCATFAVHLHSRTQQTALLQVFDVGEGAIENAVLLLHEENDLGVDWASLQIPLERCLKPFRLAFRGVIGDNMDNAYSTFAIDDVRLTPGACNAPASCSFDHDMCGWSLNSQLDWELAGPGEISLSTRPYADCTLRDNDGGFLYVEADEHLMHTTAVVQSQIIPSLIVENCLTFWYHIYGCFGTHLTARLLQVDYAIYYDLWEIIINDSTWDPGWKFASAPFSSKIKFRITIEAYLGSGFMGDIAVDDVVVASGGCAIHPKEAGRKANYIALAPLIYTELPSTTPVSGPYDCYFTLDLCSWSSSVDEGTGNIMEWTQHVADETSNGGFAFLDVTGEFMPGSHGVLRSQEVSSTRAACLSFSYLLSGPHELSIILENGAGLTEVWTHMGPAGDVWQDGQVTVASSDVFFILMLGVRGDSSNGRIGLDTLVLSLEACKIPEDDCDFENKKTCGWWLVPAQDNGPSWQWCDGQSSVADHTTDTVAGHMLRANNNFNSSTNNTAITYSPLLMSSGISCIRFFYYAHQGTDAELRVFYNEYNAEGFGYDAPVILWSSPVGQVSHWREGHVSLSVTLFKVKVEAVFGVQDNISFVAFDDFSIHVGTCGGSAECNFDGIHLCGWTQFDERAYWEVTHGVDHTYEEQGGGMLILEPTRYEAGDTAVLHSALMEPAMAVSGCLQFWFQIKDVEEGTINVYIEPLGVDRVLAWSLSGRQQDSWSVARVPLHGITDTYFTILLEGVVGVNQLQRIHIDDILEFVGTCGVWPREAEPTNNPTTITTTTPHSTTTRGGSTSATLSTRTSTSSITTTRASTTTTQDPDACSKTEFPCGDSQHICIPGLLLCDTVHDCPNDADETQCPDNAHCDIDFFYCGDPYMSDHPCMRVEHECDGISQCSRYCADESLCGSCPDNYCQNGGLCATDGKGGRPTCVCPSKYSGNRCERLAAASSTSIYPSTSATPPTTTSPEGLSAGAITGIVFGVMFTIIVGFVGFFYIKNKKRVVVEPRESSSCDVSDHQPANLPIISTNGDIPLCTRNGTSNKDTCVPGTISNPAFDP